MLLQIFDSDIHNCANYFILFFLSSLMFALNCATKCIPFILKLAVVFGSQNVILNQNDSEQRQIMELWEHFLFGVQLIELINKIYKLFWNEQDKRWNICNIYRQKGIKSTKRKLCIIVQYVVEETIFRGDCSSEGSCGDQAH